MPIRISDDWPEVISDAQDLDEIAMTHRRTFGAFEALEAEVRFWRTLFGVLLGMVLVVAAWWLLGGTQ